MTASYPASSAPRVRVGSLQVDPALHAFVADRLSPLVDLSAGQFWAVLEQLVRDLGSKNRALLDRRDALQQAIERDHFNRAKDAKPEIEFALAREKIVDVILNAMAKGKIPERITHNDTKFNNVMLDSETGAAMCVVDLDTVMPGCALYDFGDMVRTTTSPTLEDERDLSKVRMHMSIFKKLAAGYLSTAGGFLNSAEKSLMAFSGKLITFEIGIRFLTDFLSGDTYFRIHRSDHNLERCRTQFKLVESIEQQEDAMQKFVDKIEYDNAKHPKEIQTRKS
jgi:hypothetical protein